jgi:glycosyltransferase involved in cell wall biosynthesis
MEISFIVPACPSVSANRLDRWLPDLGPFTLNSEVIIIHDTRNSAKDVEFLLEMARYESTPNIQLITLEVGSVGGSRNIGMSKATGKWIQFIDLDDVPEISKTFEFIRKYAEYDVIVANFRKVDESAIEVAILNEPAVTISDLVINLGIWRLIFKSQEIEGVEFPEINMAEDQCFVVSANLTSKMIKFVDCSIYNYFISGANHLTKSKSALQQSFAAEEFLLDLFVDNVSMRNSFNFSIFSRVYFSTLQSGNLKTRQVLLSQLFENRLKGFRQDLLLQLLKYATLRSRITPHG